MASKSDIALSTQSRRHVPSIPMMQTLYPRLNVTRSGPLVCSVMSTSSNCSELRCGNASRWRFGRCCARSAGPIQPATLRIGLEGVGQPDHRFGGAEHQKAIGLGRLGEAVEYVGLGILVEIDQDVAAEDDVEDAKMGKILQQVQLPVLDHGADVGIDLPDLAYLLEVLDQHLDREAALDLELAVD